MADDPLVGVAAGDDAARSMARLPSTFVVEEVMLLFRKQADLVMNQVVAQQDIQRNETGHASSWISVLVSLPQYSFLEALGSALASISDRKLEEVLYHIARWRSSRWGTNGIRKNPLNTVPRYSFEHDERLNRAPLSPHTLAVEYLMCVTMQTVLAPTGSVKKDSIAGLDQSLVSCLHGVLQGRLNVANVRISTTPTPLGSPYFSADDYQALIEATSRIVGLLSLTSTNVILEQLKHQIGHWSEPAHPGALASLRRVRLAFHSKQQVEDSTLFLDQMWLVLSSCNNSRDCNILADALADMLLNVDRIAMSNVGTSGSVLSYASWNKTLVDIYDYALRNLKSSIRKEIRPAMYRLATATFAAAEDRKRISSEDSVLAFVSDYVLTKKMMNDKSAPHAVMITCAAICLQTWIAERSRTSEGHGSGGPRQGQGTRWVALISELFPGKISDASRSPSGALQIPEAQIDADTTAALVNLLASMARFQIDAVMERVKFCLGSDFDTFHVIGLRAFVTIDRILKDDRRHLAGDEAPSGGAVADFAGPSLLSQGHVNQVSEAAGQRLSKWSAVLRSYTIANKDKSMNSRKAQQQGVAIGEQILAAVFDSMPQILPSDWSTHIPSFLMHQSSVLRTAAEKALMRIMVALPEHRATALNCVARILTNIPLSDPGPPMSALVILDNLMRTWIGQLPLAGSTEVYVNIANAREARLDRQIREARQAQAEASSGGAASSSAATGTGSAASFDTTAALTDATPSTPNLNVLQGAALVLLCAVDGDVRCATWETLATLRDLQVRLSHVSGTPAPKMILDDLEGPIGKDIMLKAWTDPSLMQPSSKNPSTPAALMQLVDLVGMAECDEQQDRWSRVIALIAAHALKHHRHAADHARRQIRVLLLELQAFVDQAKCRTTVSDEWMHVLFIWRNLMMFTAAAEDRLAGMAQEEDEQLRMANREAATLQRVLPHDEPPQMNVSMLVHLLIPLLRADFDILVHAAVMCLSVMQIAALEAMLTELQRQTEMIFESKNRKRYHKLQTTHSLLLRLLLMRLSRKDLLPSAPSGSGVTANRSHPITRFYLFYIGRTLTWFRNGGKNEYTLQRLRYNYAMIVRQFASHTSQMGTQSGPMLEESTRRDLFQLMYPWCGHGPIAVTARNRVIARIKELERNQKDEVERIDLTEAVEHAEQYVEGAVLHAMSQLLIGRMMSKDERPSGATDIAQHGQAITHMIMLFINTLFQAQHTYVTMIGQTSFTNFLRHHPEALATAVRQSYLMNVSISSCSFQALVAHIDHVKEQDYTQFVAMPVLLNLALFKMSDPMGTVRFAAASLLKHLIYLKFKTSPKRRRFYAVIHQPGLNETYLNLQLRLSRILAYDFRNYTFALFNEVMYRLPMVSVAGQQSMLAYLQHWVANLDLASMKVERRHRALKMLLNITGLKGQGFPEHVERLWATLARGPEPRYVPSDGGAVPQLDAETARRIGERNIDEIVDFLLVTGVKAAGDFALYRETAQRISLYLMRAMPEHTVAKLVDEMADRHGWRGDNAVKDLLPGHVAVMLLQELPCERSTVFIPLMPRVLHPIIMACDHARYEVFMSAINLMLNLVQACTASRWPHNQEQYNAVLQLKKDVEAQRVAFTAPGPVKVRPMWPAVEKATVAFPSPQGVKHLTTLVRRVRDIFTRLNAPPGIPDCPATPELVLLERWRDVATQWSEVPAAGGALHYPSRSLSVIAALEPVPDPAGIHHLLVSMDTVLAKGPSAEKREERQDFTARGIDVCAALVTLICDELHCYAMLDRYPYLYWAVVALLDVDVLPIYERALKMYETMIITLLDADEDSRERLRVKLYNARPDWDGNLDSWHGMQQQLLHGLIGTKTCESIALRMLQRLPSLGLDWSSLIEPGRRRVLANLIGLLPWLAYHLGNPQMPEAVAAAYHLGELAQSYGMERLAHQLVAVYPSFVERYRDPVSAANRPTVAARCHADLENWLGQGSYSLFSAMLHEFPDEHDEFILSNLLYILRSGSAEYRVHVLVILKHWLKTIGKKMPGRPIAQLGGYFKDVTDLLHKPELYRSAIEVLKVVMAGSEQHAAGVAGVPAVGPDLRGGAVLPEIWAPEHGLSGFSVARHKLAQVLATAKASEAREVTELPSWLRVPSATLLRDEMPLSAQTPRAPHAALGGYGVNNASMRAAAGSPRSPRSDDDLGTPRTGVLRGTASPVLMRGKLALDPSHLTTPDLAAKITSATVRVRSSVASVAAADECDDAFFQMLLAAMEYADALTADYAFMHTQFASQLPPDTQIAAAACLVPDPLLASGDVVLTAAWRSIDRDLRRFLKSRPMCQDLLRSEPLLIDSWHGIRDRAASAVSTMLQRKRTYMKLRQDAHVALGAESAAEHLPRPGERDALLGLLVDLAVELWCVYELALEAVNTDFYAMVAEATRSPAYSDVYPRALREAIAQKKRQLRRLTSSVSAGG